MRLGACVVAAVAACGSVVANEDDAGVYDATFDAPLEEDVVGYDAGADDAMDVGPGTLSDGATAPDVDEAGDAGPVLVTLASTPYVRALAVDSTNVYWATGDTIAYCSKDGGAPTILATNQPGAYDVAVDSTNVYWINQNAATIMLCAIAGCGGSPTTLAYAPYMSYPTAITADGTNVFWATGAANLTTGAIYECPSTGCNQSGWLLANGMFIVASLVLHGTTIYWTDRGFNQNTIQTCPISGCDGGATVLAKANPWFDGLVVTSTSMFATDSSGEVVKCPINGCTDGGPTVVTSSQSNPYKIAADSSNIYWTNNYSGSVMKCSLGCNNDEVIIATNQSGPYGIVVDATSVYWANSGNGSIMKLSPK